ncbi:hypothetical protein [Nitratireductor basaltis]|uniref:Uncharacterized protein n=1 Tax=Nitratireductor basaltis TaxID=472175 RepID=A0A084U9Z5_9HYPH|nr:hypothetical protein [Nitratireductor basaltis]KFB09781.1 hypothetical protein EL18_00800 [Nitratireductor basaltis]
MKLLKLLRGIRHTRDKARSERQRLQRTMPGETGAMAGLKYGFLIN